MRGGATETEGSPWHARRLSDGLALASLAVSRGVQLLRTHSALSGIHYQDPGTGTDFARCQMATPFACDRARAVCSCCPTACRSPRWGRWFGRPGPMVAGLGLCWSRREKPDELTARFLSRSGASHHGASGPLMKCGRGAPPSHIRRIAQFLSVGAFKKSQRGAARRGALDYYPTNFVLVSPGAIAPSYSSELSPREKARG